MEAKVPNTLNINRTLRNAKDTIYTSVILAVPPVALTLPLYLVMNNGLSPERAAVIPLVGTMIIAVTTLFTV